MGFCLPGTSLKPPGTSLNLPPKSTNLPQSQGHPLPVNLYSLYQLKDPTCCHIKSACFPTALLFFLAHTHTLRDGFGSFILRKPFFLHTEPSSSVVSQYPRTHPHFGGIYLGQMLNSGSIREASPAASFKLRLPNK